MDEAGEGRNVSQGTAGAGSSPDTVITLRLERREPSGGRTGLVVLAVIIGFSYVVTRG